MRPAWLDLDSDETAEDVVLPVEVRVKQGMALLDEKHGPEWVYRIDVNTLRLSGYCSCVLGQLYEGKGNYGIGVVDLWPEDSDRYGPGGSVDCGFFDWSGDEYPALTTAWKHAILARRMETTS